MSEGKHFIFLFLVLKREETNRVVNFAKPNRGSLYFRFSFYKLAQITSPLGIYFANASRAGSSILRQ